MTGIITAGIDPGPENSALVIWDGERPLFFGDFANVELPYRFELIGGAHGVTHWGIERIRGFGSKAGNETFDTCEWVGRFDLFLTMAVQNVVLIPRKTVIAHHCGHATAGDADCWRALKYRFGEPGSKKARGVFFGIGGKHLPAALAVAVYLWDLNETAREKSA